MDLVRQNDGLLPAPEAILTSPVLPRDQKLLITGCHGLLGQKLVQLLKADNEILGIDLTPDTHLSGDSFQYLNVDITQREAVLSTVYDFNPSFIINTAAMTDVDGCEIEKDLCWRINVLAVENLIRGAKGISAHLIHVSSDYVFDGTQPPYHEDDSTRPLGFYGKSKLAGENALRGAGLPSTIVRTQVLYGAAPAIRSNFVSFVLNRLLSGQTLSIVDDQRGTPTLADDLALAIGRLILLHKEGIYHVSGSEAINRFEFAQAIARQFGCDPHLIQPIKTKDLQQKSPRPADSSFSIEKIQRELSFQPRDIVEGLKEFQRQWIQQQNDEGGIVG